MSKQPDSVRRQLAIGRSISCNDDDDFVECISVSRPPVPVMAEGSSFNSSDSGRMASADRFSRGHAALQDEVSQSVSDKTILVPTEMIISLETVLGFLSTRIEQDDLITEYRRSHNPEVHALSRYG